MKVVNVIVKILVALAAVAGTVYVVATYGEQLVEWAKKIMKSLPKGKCCGCGKADAEEAAEEAPAEEAPVEETPAEEAPVEEAPVEETPAEETPAEEAPAEETPAEEPAIEEDAVVAEDSDFEG